MHQDQTPSSATLSSDVRIQRGSILIYRAFDIADEVDLVAVERILSQGAGQSRMTLARPIRQSLSIRNAPVRVGLGEQSFQIGTDTVKAEVFATVWDYGVVSIVFQVPIEKGMTWAGLISRAAYLNAEAGGPGTEPPATYDELDQIARRKSSDLARLLAPALQRAHEWARFEDYVIYFLEEVTGISRASELITKADIPSLILGEARETLASKAREGIMEYVYQYATNDMVVIDWNSAIVLEPTGQRDIADVLEFALTHLLEFRYYDDLIDQRLTVLYDTIEKERHAIWRSRFANISREANTRYIEFSEFYERIDNSLKVVGDFYLAVIFRGAVRRFRIPDWQQSITRKMSLLARVSELLQGEVNVTRGHWMEATIIFLILFEIISAIVKNV